MRPFKPNKTSVERSLKMQLLLVGIEGDVYPCCVLVSLDYEGAEAQPMGNIFEDELDFIWNSERYRRA